MEYDSCKKNKKSFHQKFISQIFNAGNVFQPIWVRHNPIPTRLFDRKFVESKFYFVFYFGVIFWIIFFLGKVF